MGNCKLCGESAGWFKGVHAACVEAVETGVAQIKSTMASAVEQVAKGGTPAIQSSIEKVITDKRIPRESANAAIAESWSTAVNEVSLRELLSLEKQTALMGLCKQFGFTAQGLSKTDGFRCASLSLVLWAIVHDVKELYENVMTSQNPFNLESGDVPIAFFGSVVYSQEKTTRSRVGAYSGLSLRVAPGVYSHFGGFKGQQVEQVAMKEIDYGGMLLTTGAMYFGGQHTTFRVPFDHIISFDGRQDGIGFSRKTGKGIPEVFNILMPGKDGKPTPAPSMFGWFLLNATQALASKKSQAHATSRR